MKRIPILILILTFLLLSAACSSAPTPADNAIPTTTPQPAPAPSAPDASENQGGTISSAAGENWAGDHMIVRTADISIVVEDVPTVMEDIIALAESLGGYEVYSNRWRDSDRTFGTVSIRVPAAEFYRAMADIRGLADDIISENTASTDVTEEYVDLTAKLKNLEATEEQLLRILERAETIEETLTVQREIAVVRGEIETVKGRMQYLERTSDTSMITAMLSQSSLNVEFTGSKTKIKQREKVAFRSDVSGGYAPYSYEWDFGDGETSTDTNPVHTYRATGLYTVSLKIVDDAGATGTKVRNKYIEVLPGWSAGSVATSAKNGLFGFGRVLADIIIWLGILSPIWITIGLVIWLIKWRSKKKRSRNNQSKG